MTELSLQELLQQNKTRDDLIIISRLLEIRINRSQRKAEIARRLAEKLVQNPLLLLLQLPLQEVRNLRQMALAPDHSMAPEGTLINDCIERIGITFKPDDDENRVSVHPEVARAILPIVDGFIGLAEEEKDFYRWEQMILGMLNLYGILGMNEIERMLAGFEPGLQAEEFSYSMNRSFLIKSCGISDGEMIIFHSPFLSRADDIIQEIASRHTIRRARFSRQQIMDAGTWKIPLPPASPQTDILRRELAKHKKSPEQINLLLGECWMLLNNDFNPMEMMLQQMELKDRESIVGLMSKFINWMNVVPRWVLKGNSSNSVSQDYQQEEFDSPLEKAMPKAAASKIGRNEPCPCGSGKKYKVCCLRK